jgi:hypothetical protein
MKEKILEWTQMLEEAKIFRAKSKQNRKSKLQRLNEITKDLNIILSQYFLKMSDAFVNMENEIEILWTMKLNDKLIQFRSFNGSAFSYAWRVEDNKLDESSDDILNIEYHNSEFSKKDNDNTEEDSFEDIMDIFFQEFGTEIIDSKIDDD